MTEKSKWAQTKPELKNTKSRLLKLLAACLAMFILLNSLSPVQQTRAGAAVDLLLVIALDVSASVDIREYQLMRDGLATALSSTEIAQAVTAGENGAIAIAIMQWSGFTEQKIKIDWTRVASASDLRLLAGEVAQMSRRYEGGATDIGGSIEFSAQMLNTSPFVASRRVIDVVGDGPNNVNYSPSRARDRAVKTGIVINALAIAVGIEVLPGYFRDFVIGGEGAFVEKASDYDGFKRAIRRKLLREIGNLFLF